MIETFRKYRKAEEAVAVRPSPTGKNTRMLNIVVNRPVMFLWVEIFIDRRRLGV